MENNSPNSNINWNDVLKKEARGYNEIDLEKYNMWIKKALPHKGEH